MRGLYGAGIEMLADQTAVELGGGYGDLTQEKARDIFETLDMQAAMCVQSPSLDKGLDQNCHLPRIPCL